MREAHSEMMAAFKAWGILKMEEQKQNLYVSKLFPFAILGILLASMFCVF